MTINHGWESILLNKGLCLSDFRQKWGKNHKSLIINALHCMCFLGSPKLHDFVCQTTEMTCTNNRDDTHKQPRWPAQTTEMTRTNNRDDSKNALLGAKKLCFLQEGNKKIVRSILDWELKRTGFCQKKQYSLFCRRRYLSQQLAEFFKRVGHLDILCIVASDHSLGLQIIE